MQSCPTEQHGHLQLGRQGCRLRIDAGGLLERTAHKPSGDIEGHEVQHDRADHLQHAETQPQRPRDGGPGAARQSAGHQYGGNAKKPWHATQRTAERGGGCRSHEQLPFGADVEKPCTEGYGHREPGERQGDHPHDGG